MAAQRHHGRNALAEVVPIRPPSPPQDTRALGKVARVFASLRSQATPVGSPPRSPSSPAPRSPDHPSMLRPINPDDVA